MPAPSIVASTTSLDQEKFLATKLLARNMLRLVAASVCDKIQQPEGTGTTAYFVRYKRMSVPLVPLTEGVTPTASSFSLEQVTCTLDQWGDLIILSDVSLLTTKHPLFQEATKLLADNAQRVIDREIQIVWFANTNVTYGDASVTTRRTVTKGMKIADETLHTIGASLDDLGVPTRNGPSGDYQLASADSGGSGVMFGDHYVMIVGPQVARDIMTKGTSFGTWAAVATYARQAALYNAEVGTWLGFRVVKTNFIPKLTLFGVGTAGKTTAVTTGSDKIGVTGFNVATATSGGALKDSTTFYWKVTRKDILRGFEEAISIAHSTATGAAAAADDNTMSFTFPSTAGFVYNLYFDTVATGGDGTDANLKLVQANIAPSATVVVTAVPSTGANPPDNIRASNDADDPTTIHACYIIGAEFCGWVGLQNLQTYVAGGQASIADPLAQLRTVGYKFMAKAVVKDGTRLVRLEVPSAY